MTSLIDLLDHLQQAVSKGEPHSALALKVQNIRAESARLEAAYRAAVEAGE